LALGLQSASTFTLLLQNAKTSFGILVLSAPFIPLFGGALP